MRRKVSQLFGADLARRLGHGTAFLLLLSAAVIAPAQKAPSYYLKADQTVDLHNPKLAAAKQSCPNWGLAAGLETMLARQNVALDQNFWVMRMNFGEICVEKIPSMESLAKTANREFTLEDGRRVRLELRFIPGPPTNIDDVVIQLKSDQLSLLLWRGHPYYLTGMTYDEHIGSNGARFFAIKEFRLADTFTKQPGITFQRGRDNPDEVEGILSIRVTAL
jgi:hypothetical protein